MNRKIFLLLFSIFYFCVNISLYGLNLSSDYERIGYVDIKKVFKEFPKTREAKQKLKVKIKLKKEEIEKRKEEIKKEKEEIEKEREKIKKSEAREKSTEFDIKKGTATVVGIQSEKKKEELEQDEIQEITDEFEVEKDTTTVETIEDREMQILHKEKELKEFIKQTKKEIISRDKDYVETVLEMIYDVIEKVGHEEGISIILDKKEILYGKEVLDITDKVLERLKRQK
ncbi:OmpH family outer membrane protein [bacterium]|nr:OmpH family outer membrane protein [bacterium]